MPTSTPPSDQYVQSLARGLSVITAFDVDHPEMTLSEVADRTGLTRATARRFLHTLVQLGYVRTDGRLFTLTPQVLRLGTSYLSSLGLPEIAQPHLEALSELLGESTSAAVLDGTDIVYVARAATRRIMSVNINLGTRFPAFATSMGRVLLAGLDPVDLHTYFSVADLHSREAAVAQSEKSLRAELDRVRDQGWALVDQELEHGLRSIAAPVTSYGRVKAAINVSTAASGTADASALVNRALPQLQGAARAISADLVARS
ncbi:IclR family transcriptional regulator C-terminal domain-containing protein [soil metagenome]